MSLSLKLNSAVRSFVWKQWWNAPHNSRREKFWYAVRQKL
jgi:hypothetical protein